MCTCSCNGCSQLVLNPEWGGQFDHPRLFPTPCGLGMRLWTVSDCTLFFLQWLFLVVNPEWGGQFDKLTSDADRYFQDRGMYVYACTIRDCLLRCGTSECVSEFHYCLHVVDTIR